MPCDPNDLRKHWHSDQETILGRFPMVLGSWWEISENGDQGFTQNFDARLVSIVVYPGEPFSEKCLFWTKFQDSHVHFSRNKFPKLIFSKCCIQEGAEMISDPVFPGSRVPKINWDPVFPGSKVLRMACFPIFWSSQVLKMGRFPRLLKSHVSKPTQNPIETIRAIWGNINRKLCR